MTLSLQSTVTLRSGGIMPLLGFGVYQSTSASASSTTALKAGYRHIDSARIYRNEIEVVTAVKAWKESGGDGQVFLTTKVTGKEHGKVKTNAAVDESNARAEAAGQSWDLFLLHDPTSGPVRRLEAWKVLESKVKEGKLKAIGVSNFSDVHLEELRNAGLSVPEVNQIELHPFCQQKPIVEYCKKNGIVVQAYCPLMRGNRHDHSIIQSISKKYSKSPAQILIRWSLQSGFVPLPKSDTPSRILENADVFGFELDEESMTELGSLDEGAKGAVSWNPVGNK